MLMQMLYIASYFIEFAHEVVMFWANEKLGPALELFQSLAGFRKDQAINASAELMSGDP